MARRPAASEAILVISLELAAVGFFTLIAGASTETGTAMVIIMVGLWLIYLIQESGAIGNLNKALQSLISNPSYS